MSSVWNFCSLLSDIISQGNQLWHCKSVSYFLRLPWHRVITLPSKKNQVITECHPLAPEHLNLNDKIFILSFIVFSSANKSSVLDDKLHAGKRYLLFLLFSGFDFYKLMSAVILSCNGRCFRCFTYC